VARDLADPRWKRIRVRNPLVGKWWRGVVIGGARGETATRGLGESASLVLYEDGEERVEDLDEVEWEERGSSDSVQKRPSVVAKASTMRFLWPRSFPSRLISPTSPRRRSTMSS